MLVEAIKKELAEAQNSLQQYQNALKDCDAKGAERYLALNAIRQLIAYHQQEVRELTDKLENLAHTTTSDYKP